MFTSLSTLLFLTAERAADPFVDDISVDAAPLTPTSVAEGDVIRLHASISAIGVSRTNKHTRVDIGDLSFSLVLNANRLPCGNLPHIKC
jgi:hypothetical protein